MRQSDGRGNNVGYRGLIALFIAVSIATAVFHLWRADKNNSVSIGASLLSPVFDTFPQADDPRVKPVVTHPVPFPVAAPTSAEPVSSPPGVLPRPKRVKPVAVTSDGRIVGDE